MKLVNTDAAIPIKSWCEDVDAGAMEQAVNLANHPRMFKHVALMPDCHQGYGMPIGGVIACNDAVIPNAVGVDIGCGMCAVKTDALVSDVDTDIVKAILNDIKRGVPVGFDHHKEQQEWSGFDNAPDVEIVQQQIESAKSQLGTLGGGNHFIEIQSGDDGHVWFMLHSGSRNFGYRIAKEYNSKAQALCEMWHSAIPEYTGEDGLAFLPIGTREAREYIKAMNFALAFALENRLRMMGELIRNAARHGVQVSSEPINIHHNFAALENHFGRNVWIHRKGATKADAGLRGIIPGSMGTSSYIVKGLGNPESFASCSHGAGRHCGRAEFSRTHSVEACDASMAGIVFDGWGKDRKGNPDLSEAPGAYKDIDAVLAAEDDLVGIDVRLRPLGVVKG